MHVNPDLGQRHLTLYGVSGAVTLKRPANSAPARPVIPTTGPLRAEVQIGLRRKERNPFDEPLRYTTAAMTHRGDGKGAGTIAAGQSWDALWSRSSGPGRKSVTVAPANSPGAPSATTPEDSATTAPQTVPEPEPEANAEPASAPSSPSGATPAAEGYSEATAILSPAPASATDETTPGAATVSPSPPAPDTTTIQRLRAALGRILWSG